jgi:hypothetical protein
MKIQISIGVKVLKRGHSIWMKTELAMIVLNIARCKKRRQVLNFYFVHLYHVRK